MSARAGRGRHITERAMEIKDIDAYRPGPARTPADEPLTAPDLTGELRDILPPDLARLLASARETYWDDYFKRAGRELVFRFDGRMDLVVSYGYDYRDVDPAREQYAVMESASYTLSLLRAIAARTPVMLPFFSRDNGDFGASVDLPELAAVPDLTPAQRERKVWEVRKALDPDVRGWRLVAAARSVAVILSPARTRWGHEACICIPYDCPPRHYRTILRDAGLWLELKEVWDGTPEAAVGLVERAGDEA